MIVEAGEIDTRITLRRRSQKKDPNYGSFEDSYKEVSTVWGKLKEVTPKRLEVAKGYSPTVNYEILLRYCPVATTRMEAVANGNVYHVDGVLHGTKKDWTNLFCTAIKQ